MQIVFLRGEANEFHHDHGADGDTCIVGFAFVFDKVVDFCGNHAVEAIGTVVGGDVKRAVQIFEFFFVNDGLFVLEADDDIAVDAAFRQVTDLRIDRSGTDAAADK